MGTVNIEAFGISDMQMPEIAGRYSGKLLIVSSGRCVWDDLQRFSIPCKHGQEGVLFDGDVMAVNDIGMHLPCRIDHWYSNDGWMLPNWKEARRPEFKRWKEEISLHSIMPKTPGVHKWPWPGQGGSGLASIYTGLGLGYDEITVAGMPSDNTGHYFDPPWVKTHFEQMVSSQKDCPENRYWKTGRLRIFDGRVKVISGRPAAWL